MKNTLINVQKRQKRLLDILTRLQESTVDELSKYCSVSPATIRRDLIVMDEMGLIKRTHGKAMIIDSSESIEDNSEITRIQHALAKAACSFIKDQDIIFINSSQTALYCMNYLGNNHTTIITNNVRAVHLKPDNRTTLVLSGGEIRYPKEAMVGDIAINTISNITSSICLMGCNGINAVAGITTESMHEAKVNNLFFEKTSGIKIILADYRKIGSKSPFRSADCSKVDILITDIYAPADELRALEKTGIKIIQIDPHT